RWPDVQALQLAHPLLLEWPQRAAPRVQPGNPDQKQPSSGRRIGPGELFQLLAEPLESQIELQRGGVFAEQLAHRLDLAIPARPDNFRTFGYLRGHSRGFSTGG